MLKITSSIKPLTLEGKNYHHHKLYVHKGSGLYSILEEYQPKGDKDVHSDIKLLNDLLIKLNHHYSLNLDLSHFKYTNVDVGITIEDHSTSIEERIFKVFDGIIQDDNKTYTKLEQLLIRIETLFTVLDTDTIRKVLVDSFNMIGYSMKESSE